MWTIKNPLVGTTSQSRNGELQHISSSHDIWPDQISENDWLVSSPEKGVRDTSLEEGITVIPFEPGVTEPWKDPGYSSNSTPNIHWLSQNLVSFLMLYDNGTFAKETEPDDMLRDTVFEGILKELSNLENEALEDGYPPPSPIAMAHAGRLIHEMYRLSPRQFLVDSMPEEGVAISVTGGYKSSVLIVCESDGGALCSVNMNGEHRRARYSNAEMLPDGFLGEALAELEKREFVEFYRYSWSYFSEGNSRKRGFFK